MFKSVAAGSVIFRAAPGLDANAIAEVRECVHGRLLRCFVRCGLLKADNARKEIGVSIRNWGQSTFIVMRNYSDSLRRCQNIKPRQLREIAIMRDKRLSAYIQQKNWNLTPISHGKYWPPVGRVDNICGDRNLFCSCVPEGDYAA